jgi:pimeloyl-ACP methyl ester carboxylesterase
MMLNRVVGALLVTIAVGGCGGSSSPPRAQHPTPTAEQAPAALPAPSEQCGPPDMPAKALRFQTEDGVTLAGAVAGSGPVGAVLVHEYPGPMCGWWPYAAYLARHGVSALLFDLRCFGLSECPKGGRGEATADVAAAMRALRREGAQSVALVGASMGGAVAVVAAGELGPDALVDLSGERDTTDLTPGIAANAAAAVPRVSAPALFVVARGDRYVPVADMRGVFTRAGSKTKRLIVLPAAAGHGWSMLLGLEAKWSPLAARVAKFIREHGAPAPRTIHFRASDGTALAGNYLPGPRPHSPAVVLVHQYRGGPDQWDPLIPVLHRAGYATLAYASRSAAELDERVLAKDVAGAVAALRGRPEVDGRRIGLLGASIGATTVAFTIGHDPALRLRAAVGLSPVESPGLIDAGTKGRFRPHDLLLIADRREIADSKSIADDAGAKGVTTRVAPANGHGVALLPDRSVRQAILSWLGERLSE